MARTRLVLNFPGFEKTAVGHQLDRIRHGAKKTGELWGYACERLAVEEWPAESCAISRWQSGGQNGAAEIRLVQFDWHDIIDSYENAPHPRAFFANFPKFMAFFADGTVTRYFRHAKRYFGFTIFPLLLIAAFFALSLALSLWLASSLGLIGVARWLLALPAAAAATLVLCKWPGERFYLLLTVNDWGFARDMVNRTNPQVEERYRRFADVVAREIGAGNHDEVLVAGHSFGAVWAVAALALALERRPDLLKGRDVTFLALGSSLLKIAFAANAGFMRDWTARIGAQAGLLWHEIQTKDDLIAFYKADPFAVLGLSPIAATLKIDRIRFRDSMEKARYRAMRKSFYRTHRQYILYQDRRVAFDYLNRIFGPDGQAARQRA
jgi:hypothetical protein